MPWSIFFFVGGALLRYCSFRMRTAETTVWRRQMRSAGDTDSFRPQMAGAGGVRYQPPDIVPMQTANTGRCPVAATVATSRPRHAAPGICAAATARSDSGQASVPAKPEPKLQQKHKVAKRRAAPPVMLVAQQPQFGFFGKHLVTPRVDRDPGRRDCSAAAADALDLVFRSLSAPAIGLDVGSLAWRRHPEWRAVHAVGAHTPANP